MINLCLAILSSAAISVLMRIGDPYIKNNMIMFVANYAVCGLLSFLFLVLDEGITFLSIEGLDQRAVIFAVGLGLFFKEKLSRRKMIGLGVVILSILLLS